MLLGCPCFFGTLFYSLRFQFELSGLCYCCCLWRCCCCFCCAHILWYPGKRQAPLPAWLSDCLPACLSVSISVFLWLSLSRFPSLSLCLAYQFQLVLLYDPANCVVNRWQNLQMSVFKRKSRSQRAGEDKRIYCYQTKPVPEYIYRSTHMQIFCQ